MKLSFVKKCVLPSAILAFAISNGANAVSPISYNFATIQYVNQELDSLDCDQGGLTLGGNLEVNENIFALGSFTDVSGDICGSETFTVGAGYKQDFSVDGSFYGSLSYVNTDVDSEGIDGDSGLGIAVGARVMFTSELEGRLELSRTTTFDGNTLLSGGVSYWFAERLSLHGDVGLGSETSSIAAGVRFDF